MLVFVSYSCKARHSHHKMAATAAPRRPTPPTLAKNGAGDASGPAQQVSASSSLGGAHSVAFDVCVQSLMSGCVNSFVSIFTLSHRPPVCVDELAQVMFSVPDDRLPWCLERLMSAELQRRRSQFRAVLDEHYQLADYFESCGDKQLAIRHHLHALQHASESSDAALEIEAHSRAASMYERQKMLGEATVHYETRLRLCELTGDAAARSEASRPLIKVLLARGHDAMKEQQFESAKQLFEVAVNAAKAVGDVAGEADAYAALGNVTVVLGDMRKALDYQRRFLVVARESKNTVAESAASLEVAKLQDALGQSTEAIESLKSALCVAEEANDLRSINEACRLLGEAYRRQPNGLTKAVHYLREHFRASRDLGDTAILESARISLGMALGEHHFAASSGAASSSGFLGVCVDDLPTLLEWLGAGEM